MSICQPSMIDLLLGEQETNQNAYPVVFLYLPIAGEGDCVLPMGAVGKLEEAGEHPSVFLDIWKYRILEIYSMWKEVVVLIHSGEQKYRITVKTFIAQSIR